MLIPARLRLTQLLACGALVLGSGLARADGAFPDASQILVPSDKPNEIVVGTNFGLLTSQDAGKSWSWVCEEEIAPCAKLYQMAPAPSDEIFATSTTGLVSLGADACGYALASGLSGISVNDAFIDPTSAARMLALGISPLDGGAEQSSLFVSSDGGKSFGGAVYSAPIGSTLTGVEIAASRPATVYLTQNQTTPAAATILRATDGGTTFTAYSQAATLGTLTLRIALVDPTNPDVVYFRARDASGAESLVVTRDGGMTSAVAQALPAGYQMSTFIRLADGTLLLVGLQTNAQGSVDCNSNAPYSDALPAAYRSSDGGQTFATWANAPRLRGLAERAGTLYGAADNFNDGYAVGQSTDGGKSWKPLLKYVDIKGPLTCSSVAATCAGPWVTLQTTFGIMPGGGSSGSGGSSTSKHGCSFSPVGGHARELWLLAPLALLLLGWRRRRNA